MPDNEYEELLKALGKKADWDAEINKLDIDNRIKRFFKVKMEFD